MINYKTLALIINFLMIMGNANADIYSENSTQGEIFIKTTKNKAGFIRFQQCEIPIIEKEKLCSSCQVTNYDKEKCSDVLSGTSRIYYSPQILSDISKSLKSSATTGTAVSIIFLLGAGLIQNAETLVASKTISPRILSGKKVVLVNLPNKTLEEIRLIEKKGEVINLSMTSYRKGLRRVLEKYNKEHK